MRRWVAGALAVLVVLVLGAAWGSNRGVLLDEHAEDACAAVRTHDRARGEGVRLRAATGAVEAAARSAVDDLRRDAEAGFPAVAAWCSANA